MPFLSANAPTTATIADCTEKRTEVIERRDCFQRVKIPS